MDSCPLTESVEATFSQQDFPSRKPTTKGASFIMPETDKLLTELYEVHDYVDALVDYQHLLRLCLEQHNSYSRDRNAKHKQVALLLGIYISFVESLLDETKYHLKVAEDLVEKLNSSVEVSPND
jgi:hypothetical protein